MCVASVPSPLLQPVSERCFAALPLGAPRVLHPLNQPGTPGLPRAWGLGHVPLFPGGFALGGQAQMDGGVPLTAPPVLPTGRAGGPGDS